MKLIISIDVEEEGLFKGRYPSTPAGVNNVRELHRLAFVSDEFGIPLTLLASHAVAAEPAAAGTLADWASRRGAEIGAHLHPWNTPPINDPSAGAAAKLDGLLGAIRRGTGATPRAFRMGRFEWEPSLLTLLPERGITTDSSLVPLRYNGGEVATHFLAPPDPYPIGPDLLEIPITMVPLIPGSPRLAAGVASRLPAVARRGLLTGFRYVAAVGIHPAWFSLPAMCWAARLHRNRGGRVLHLFLHSSELMAGGAPVSPTPLAVDRLIGKLRQFLSWLKQEMDVQGTTMSGLRASPRTDTNPPSP